jgi:hypothetical protein
MSTQVEPALAPLNMGRVYLLAHKLRAVGLDEDERHEMHAMIDGLIARSLSPSEAATALACVEHSAHVMGGMFGQERPLAIRLGEIAGS